MAIGIVAFGTVQIRYAQPLEAYWVKQLIGLGIALVAMFAVAFTDYRRLLNIAPAFYVFGLLLLILVLIPGIGLKINGQRAWIKVPGIGQFQPSEFVKVTTAMMLARYFGKHRLESLRVKEMIVGGLILALPIGLILMEPDVGSVLTYIPILAVVLFLSAIRMRLVIASRRDRRGDAAGRLLGRSEDSSGQSRISRNGSMSSSIPRTPTGAALATTPGNRF